ncbi:hypothetical protein [Fastidiosibacter lacustris]|uniref:hypothetical protein n=1 Tax=Fastidiosibacter lacustris TaxID=2056695 RepID=UPI000E34154B|nr:hypothetical protein [Fastidiosibacter lacustris]
MTDTPIRKTLSLKRKKIAEGNNTKQHSSSTNNNNYQHRKPLQYNQEQNESFNKAEGKMQQGTDYIKLLANKDPILEDLQQKRAALLTQINILEQRLIFISSEPLQAACNELKQQDTKILCKINDYLISK